jgi:hypothetical protein
MKAIFASVCLALTSFSPAEAKGCIKGAIVGGVAGHIGWPRQARRGGLLCGRPSRGQQAQSQRLERAGPVRAEVADRTTPLSQPTRNAP